MPLARRGRFDNLRRIEALDPEVDADEILWITSRLDFPWDFTQGTGIAFMRDYGVPSISGLLHRTGEFEHHGTKRYDDTILIGQEATIEGIDSPRGHAAVRRLNRIHGHYDIPDHELRYVLATTIVGPVRWISDFGWRDLHPHELTALTRVTTRFGELMGLRGLPPTYDGYLRLLVDYECDHFKHHPDNTALTEASVAIARHVAPLPVRPLVRRVTVALFDEPLRAALGMPRQPRWFVAAVRRGLRLRGRLLRWFGTPRRTPSFHAPTTYPGGHTLAHLGPVAMLDELNRVPGAVG
jgi:hypothetical protein